MAKNAVYNLSVHDLVFDVPLKRISLFFNKMYITDFESIIQFAPHYLKFIEESDPERIPLFKENLASVEYLITENIISDYDSSKFNYDTHLILDAFLHTNEDPRTELKEIASSPVRADGSYTAYYARNEFMDYMMRIDAATMTANGNDEFFPILKSNTSFENIGKKEKVIQLLLNKIPEPDDSTSWEQIMEFRSDKDVRNKYLALMNWINEISASAYSLQEINEKYEYLYNDYIKHFNLHKIKYSNTTLEILVTAGASILLGLQSSEYITPFKDLLKLKLSHVHLLEQEAKLPGKELAYIYKANQAFTS